MYNQCTLSTDPLALRTHAGLLPVADLRLDSYVYKQQPTLSRSSYSHVDNEGVKALVDGICNRWCAQNSGEWRHPGSTSRVCLWGNALPRGCYCNDDAPWPSVSLRSALCIMPSAWTKRRLPS